VRQVLQFLIAADGVQVNPPTSNKTAKAKNMYHETRKKVRRAGMIPGSPRVRLGFVIRNSVLTLPVQK
jgi:hypothetical protein